MTVLLVRHAMPSASTACPSSAWPLTAAGRAAATTLRPLLPRRAVWASSTERKAVETLTLAAPPGVALAQDRRFDEVARPGEPFDHDVRARRRAWVEGRLDDRHAGWETLEDAAERFEAGVSDLRSAEPLVIVTHGLVLTAWLVSIGQVAPGRSAGDLWCSLRFPEVVEASRAGR